MEEMFSGLTTRMVRENYNTVLILVDIIVPHASILCWTYVFTYPCNMLLFCISDESLNGSGSGSGDGLGSEDDDTRHEGSGDSHNRDDLHFGPVPELGGNAAPIDKGTVVENVHQPSYPTHNTEDNHLHPSSGLDTNALDDGVVATRSNTTAGGSGIQEISITRAVITYLFPIFVCWVGSSFSDLL